MSIAFNCFNGLKVCHKNMNITHISPQSSKSEKKNQILKGITTKNKFKSSKKVWALLKTFPFYTL